MAWRKSIPEDNAPSSYMGALALGLFCLIIFSAFFAYVALQKHREGMVVVGCMTLGCLVWVSLAVAGILSAVRSRTMRLDLREAMPAVGGRLLATLRLVGRASPASLVMAELVCARTRDEGGRRSVEKYEMWKTGREFSTRQEGSTTTAAIVFEIPRTALPSGDWDSGDPKDDNASNTIEWRLNVSAAVGKELVENHFVVKVLPQPAGPLAWTRDFGVVVPVAANLVPLYAVLMGHAGVTALALFYWAEIVVTSILTLLRIACAARGSVGGRILAPLVAGLFFGFYCYFLGGWMFDLLYHPVRSTAYLSVWGIAALIVRHLDEAGFRPALLVMVLSQGMNFYLGYLVSGKYLQARVTNTADLAMNRLSVLFVLPFVMYGLWFIGSPVFVFVTLVTAKAAYDGWSYLHERHTAPRTVVASGVKMRP